MFKSFGNKKGFTIAEVMFVAVISVIVLVSIISIWTFTYKQWIKENRKTQVRVGLIKAMETVKDDLRLSSLTYISFYPSDAYPYTAISVPVAEIDANGLLTLNSDGDIDWDKTVVYHMYSNGDGTQNLRRTVIDPRNNSLSENERYTQMENIVNSGVGSVNATTDTEFLVNASSFTISSLAPVIDFYDESGTPVRDGKVIFGWAKLGPGDHTIKFEITGKNESSSGYDIGIDSIIIEPSGSVREAEYYASAYAPSGALTVSGGNADRVYGTNWGNNNYLEFDVTGVSSYIEFEDYYDLWRESGFETAALNNVEYIEEEVRIGLDISDLGEAGRVTWFSYTQAGDSEQDGRDSFLPAYNEGIAIRTIVLNTDLDSSGDLVRVKFKSASENPLRIDAAYITRRDSGEDGFVNASSGTNPEDYHFHQQLFFADEYDMDASREYVEFLYIPPDSNRWSEWVGFPLIVEDSSSNPQEYFITFCLGDQSAVTFPASFDSYVASDENCKNWIGTGTNSYYVTEADVLPAGGTFTDVLQASGTPVWSGGSYSTNLSNNIYISAEIDTTVNEGFVESRAFDTTLENPVYNQIAWSQNSPSGTTINLKTRSSDDSYMSGATDWDLIIGSGTTPHSLSIGAGRYVQFLAELFSDIYWVAASGGSLSYQDYVNQQRSLPVYSFPIGGSGDFYVTNAVSPWIDDIQIDWPGEDRICTITGYIAKQNNYGQAKVTIDDLDLVKILSVYFEVEEDIAGTNLVENGYVEIEPRNTGK